MIITKAAAVRYALLVYDGDPETAPYDRILALAKIKLQQESRHELVKGLCKQNISAAKCCIANRYGYPITKDKIRKYEEEAIKNPYVRSDYIASVAKFNMTIAKPIGTSLAELKQASEFAKSVGGIDRAATLLIELKELTEWSQQTP